jgi:hypothetical protein
MSKPTLYKDLGKRASDLLTKDFPAEENKFEWKGLALSALTVDATLTKTKDGSVVGTVTDTIKFPEYGTNLTVESNTKKEFKVEAVNENKLAKNLKATLTAEVKNENFVTASAEYKHELFAFNGSADFGKNAGSTLKGGLVFAHNGWSFGASSEYLNGVKNFNTTVAFSNGSADASVFGRMDLVKEKNEVGASYFHTVNSDLSVATEVVVDTNSDSKPKLVLGTQTKLNDDSSVKTKFDTNGIFNVAFSQKFNKNAKVLVGAQVDTNNFAKANIGWTFTFNY